jgi:hypothetical protein
LRRDDVKREFGNKVIDEIIKRTDKSIDKHNVGFVKYSKFYKNSDAFKIHGKSSKVNLKLTGEMRADMSVTGVTATAVKISFPNPEQNKKADGHIRGLGSLPIRDFFGLPQTDLENLMKKTVANLDAEIQAAQVIDALSGLSEQVADTTIATQTELLFIADEVGDEIG